MKPLLVLLAGSLVAACSDKAPSLDSDLGPVELHGDALSLTLQQTTGMGMTPGNQIDLFPNGSVFEGIRKEISRAKTSVNIILFIWRAGEPGDSIADALLAKTKEGVACRVLVDPVGSKGFKEEVQPKLEAGGCEVKLFRSLGKTGKLLGRNHRKLVVVDGKVAFTGGFAFYKVWLGEGRAEEEWRDEALRVEGPAVDEIQQTFSENWLESGGKLLPREEFPGAAKVGQTPALYVSSKEEAGGTDAYWMTRVLIEGAKKRIWIANAYFVPSEQLQRLLIEKSQAGLDVRVLAPGPIHDVPPIRAAQRMTYRELIAGGVRIWEYQPSMLHSKTMVVDDHLAVIGSINLDPLSLNKLEEGSMVMEDRAIATELEKSFLKDATFAIEITPENLPKRSLFGRASMAARRLIQR